MRVLVTVKNILKGVRTEKRGIKDFKMGGRQAGSRSGCLKGGGLEPPYELCIGESTPNST